MFLGPEGAFVGIVPRYTAVRPLMRYTTNTVVADNKKNSKLQHLEKQEAQLL